jgi:hypothetical protein
MASALRTRPRGSLCVAICRQRGEIGQAAASSGAPYRHGRAQRLMLGLKPGDYIPFS